MEKLFDLVIKNARVVRPNKTSVDCLDIAVKDEKISRLAPDIQEEILFLPRTLQGRDPIQLRQLLPIAVVPDWRKQRVRWKELIH